MNEQPPLPNRVSWFAPWTWKRRWKIAAIILLMYQPSYPLAIYTAWRLKKLFPDSDIIGTAGALYSVIYAPIQFLLEYCPPVVWLHKAELHLLLTVFGTP